MPILVSILHPRISSPDYQDFRDSLLALIPEQQSGYVVHGGWNGHGDLGLEVEAGEDTVLGIGQVMIEGETPLIADTLDGMRALSEKNGAHFLQHPNGAFQGDALTADGNLVQVEGLAADVFGGSVFDLAFQGHPACLVFLRRVMPFADGPTQELVVRCIDEPEVRQSARTQLEQSSGVSLNDNSLYYAKGEDGLGNVYSSLELDQTPVTVSE